jgi:hypothetical protein
MRRAIGWILAALAAYGVWMGVTSPAFDRVLNGDPNYKFGAGRPSEWVTVCYPKNGGKLKDAGRFLRSQGYPDNLGWGTDKAWSLDDGFLVCPGGDTEFAVHYRKPPPDFQLK